jgi:sulfoxide reductase catalytic subunit YedY
VKKIKSSEITPERLFLTRRKFLAGLGTLAAGAALASCQAPGSTGPSTSQTGTSTSTTETTTTTTSTPTADQLTPYEDVINYNNYYEFSLGKTGIGPLSKDFKTSPWTVEVGGLVNKPQTFAIEDLEGRFPSEERVYRHRCVEAWSMVIPWLGFPLGKLLAVAEPLSSAKFVAFQTLYDPEQMPGQDLQILDWPYREGLRLDEAMHDLTIMSTGLYGKPLLPQCGAPLRLVVPWKYGFKCIKSIVKIDLVEDMPPTAWSQASPGEYGFYANVNPDVPHPRWSQSSERRIGGSRISTQLFNGYADEVASLYAAAGGLYHHQCPGHPAALVAGRGRLARPPVRQPHHRCPGPHRHLCPCPADHFAGGHTAVLAVGLCLAEATAPSRRALRLRLRRDTPGQPRLAGLRL